MGVHETESTKWSYQDVVVYVDRKPKRVTLSMTMTEVINLDNYHTEVSVQISPAIKIRNMMVLSEFTIQLVVGTDIGNATMDVLKAVYGFTGHEVSLARATFNTGGELTTK